MKMYNVWVHIAFQIPAETPLDATNRVHDLNFATLLTGSETVAMIEMDDSLTTEVER